MARKPKTPVAPAGTPTSPEKCATCGAEPGDPCVYVGTVAVRYMLHRARRRAATGGVR